MMIFQQKSILQMSIVKPNNQTFTSLLTVIQIEMICPQYVSLNVVFPSIEELTKSPKNNLNKVTYSEKHQRNMKFHLRQCIRNKYEKNISNSFSFCARFLLVDTAPTMCILLCINMHWNIVSIPQSVPSKFAVGRFQI